eukprot:CAMPEP_0183706394 /NCGR_PEP_ID=MMETSP0737-20130205/3245_1 /TAXON_ID=385413 /ORGANISM="Thalassiosira miniscula, Strain CCMP1093" /LENGTH=567 /DNA_ID=CAMNT_0025933807 /DNA_START=37 /DNA_END=1740 /DNA_ORIENTATION=-
MISVQARLIRHHASATFSKLQKTPPLVNNLPKRGPQEHRRFLSADSEFNLSKNRLRRSVHFVPADNEKFLSKSLALGADTLVYDLEDSVKDKEAGRDKLNAFLTSEEIPNATVGTKRSEVLVRINPLSVTNEFGRELWRDDLRAGMHGADGFMIPKVESIDELRLLDEALAEMEHQGGGPKKVLFPIATETPAAVLNIAEIAKGPRVVAITWGCEDLSAEIGSYGTRTDAGGYLDVFRHCRTMTLLAAKAANVQAIDGIYQNVRDLTGFDAEANDAKYAGFDGKLTLHPHQIGAVHKVFEPTNEEWKEAMDIVSLWEDDDGGDGKGSLEYHGKMIDLPHYVRAKKVLARSTKREGGRKEEGGTSTTDTTIFTSSGSESAQTSSPSTPNNGKEGEDSDEVFPRVYLGKYFEDLHPGLTIRHFLTRTVTESDNVFFTCLTLNPAPIHLDHELSKGNSSALSSGGGSDRANSNAGKPLFNSMFTLALLVGMSVPECTHGTTVANLGFSEVLFPKPVYPGDTLRAETIILDRRESKSRPTQGIVTLQHVAYNQRGDAVCKATRQALMKKRP